MEISWTSPRRSSKLRFSLSKSSLLIKYLPHKLMPKQLHVLERRLPVSLKSKSSPWWSWRRGFKSLENPDPPVWRQRNRRTQIRHSQSHSRKEKLPQLAISKAALRGWEKNQSWIRWLELSGCLCGHVARGRRASFTVNYKSMFPVAASRSVQGGGGASAFLADVKQSDTLTVSRQRRQ